MKCLVFLLIFFFSSLVFGGKLPEIEPRDVVDMLEEIMQAHASAKKLTPSLVKRAIANYLDELDPMKSYFLEDEVSQWLNLNEEELQTLTCAIEKSDFTFFTLIHKKLVDSIERRNRLEKEGGDIKELSRKVSFKDFQDPPFAKNEEELRTKLSLIKALQYKALEKLEEKTREKALQRIIKRRTLHEEEMATLDEVEKKRYILTHALKALASSFDTHTAYFTPTEASQFMIQVQQRLFGIGAQLRDDITGFTVVKIIDGGPAYQNGQLKVDDRVIAINKEPVVGMEIMDAVELIRGEEGTKVALTILREDSKGKEESLDLDITRGEVVIQESRLRSETVPFGDGVIAHISLFAFYQDPSHSSANDLYEEILKIKKEDKLRGVILDLRQNAGGVLPQAVAVTGLFIMKGIVVSVKDNRGHVESLRNIDGKAAWDGPLIILTSKASASAAEIVAQTLQDYGRAVVVGDEHTFGKGTFQTFTLDTEKGKVNPKGEFKVTRGKYYTVSGKSPQLVGVKPDIIVPGLLSKAEIGEQYTEFPLENDAIAENFDDDLTDIPSPQREQIHWLYRFNLQPRLKTYARLLPTLKKNSEIRLQDKFYTHFLTELDKEGGNLELFEEADLQLKESFNIMKDLIVLSE